MPCSPPIRSRASAPSLLADLRDDGRDRVVFVSGDPHHTRRLGGAEADRERRPEGDRHLAEELPGRASADDALDPVDELDRLQAPFEHGEERALVALVDGVLAGSEPDVRGSPGEPLAVDRSEPREDRDAAISSGVTTPVPAHLSWRDLTGGRPDERHPVRPRTTWFRPAADARRGPRLRTLEPWNNAHADSMKHSGQLAARGRSAA